MKKLLNPHLRNKKLVLASVSPRRIDMFNDAGYDFDIIPSEADENCPLSDISPFETTMFLAMKKALDVEKKVDCGTIIVSGDTVVYKNKIMGKPKDKQDAFNMLYPLRNNWHLVVTGVCILIAHTNYKECFYDTTKVFFKDFSKDELNNYLKTDEPYDKAGGYAIQGAFRKHISKYEGNLNNVIGFPIEKITEKLNIILDNKKDE